MKVSDFRILASSDREQRQIRSESGKDRSFFVGSEQYLCARKLIGTSACIRWSETGEISDRFPGARILIHTDTILSVLNAADRILLSVLNLDMWNNQKRDTIDI